MLCFFYRLEVWVLDRERDCGMLIRQINNALEKRCNSQLKEIDLTFSQMAALIELSNTSAKKLTFKELEKRMSLAQSTTAGLISRLEQKKLVSVSGDEGDKRIKYVEVTALGETYCNRAKQDMEDMEAKLLEDLSEEEKEILISLLNKVNLKLKDV